MKPGVWTTSFANRRAFVGGSDARIIMGDDESSLLRLWREKRGEIEPEDLSGNLVVRALARKVSDEFTVALCRSHHRELHQRGDERIWWQQLSIDPIESASALW